jgi:hypothetical protein
LFGSLSGLSGSTLLNGGGDQFGSFSSNNLNAGLNNNINNNFGTGSNSQFSSFSSSGTGTATAPTSGIRTVRT